MELLGSSNKKLERKWKKTLILEKNCSSRASLTLTVTNEEKKIVNDWGDKCSIVPNIHTPSRQEILIFQKEMVFCLLEVIYIHPMLIQ